MRVAVFSDIHGNMYFFDAVLKALEEFDIDRMVFLGDAVSYYPNGNAVLNTLRELNVTCVEGNHDSMLRGEYPIPPRKDDIYHLKACIPTISAENMAFVRSWPEIIYGTIDNYRVTFVHGCPFDHLKGYGYENTSMAEFDDPSISVLFMGHTHRPWMRQNTHTIVVNVGSVGLPRDIGCSPSFAVMDSLTGDIRLERITVDTSPIFSNPGNLHEDVLKVLKRGTPCQNE